MNARQTPDVIRFHIPGLPVAQPRQRTRIVQGTGRTFTQNYTPTKSPVNAFKAAIRLAASAAVGEVLDGPVGLAVHCLFPSLRVWYD